jgi:hypothetical protein
MGLGERLITHISALCNPSIRKQDLKPDEAIKLLHIASTNDMGRGSEVSTRSGD